jgi:hypothetical protein
MQPRGDLYLPPFATFALAYTIVSTPEVRNRLVRLKRYMS